MIYAVRQKQKVGQGNSLKNRGKHVYVAWKAYKTASTSKFLAWRFADNIIAGLEIYTALVCLLLNNLWSTHKIYPTESSDFY